MKTWIMIMLWSHFSGGWHTVNVPNLPSEKVCNEVALSTIKIVNPWNVKYRCIEIDSK